MQGSTRFYKSSNTLSLFPSLAATCRGVIYVTGSSSAAGGTDVTATASADNVTSIELPFWWFHFYTSTSLLTFQQHIGLIAWNSDPNSCSTINVHTCFSSQGSATLVYIVYVTEQVTYSFCFLHCWSTGGERNPVDAMVTMVQQSSFTTKIA